MRVKSVNIITSLCGAGLQREAEILRDLLKTYNIESRLVHYTAGPNVELKPADLNICLEVMLHQAFALAPVTWYAPNSEWYPGMYDQYLPQISKILCKTRDCQRIWSEKVGPEKCVFTSFEARDLYDPAIPRLDKFLHVAGKSQHKGTEFVIEAWQQAPDLPPLTVVASHPDYGAQIAKNPANITYVPRASEQDLIQLMNSHRFHIQPSKYEGFGHILWESLGCDGYLITTWAPPMNEYPMFGALPVRASRKQQLAMLHDVDPVAIGGMIMQAMEQLRSYPDREPQTYRGLFLKNNQFFRETFLKMIEEL